MAPIQTLLQGTCPGLSPPTLCPKRDEYYTNQFHSSSLEACVPQVRVSLRGNRLSIII
jgi:hypothetical protein